LGTATVTKRIVTEKNASPIVFANAAGLVLPHGASDKESIRAQFSSSDRKDHVDKLFAHTEITRRLAWVILSGLDSGVSYWSKPHFLKKCRDLGIPAISVPFFYGTNLDKIARAIRPAEERELRSIFETFMFGTYT
jgi:hypothetical protein